MSKLRSRRKHLFRALAVGGALLFTFALGEVVVRLRYPITKPRPYFWPGIYEAAESPVLWRLSPNYVGTYQQQFTPLKTRTNALGMRDPEFTSARRDASQRVLLLGDSVAFGRGVEDNKTFARHLEAYWGAGTAVFNAGVPGYDSVQEHLSLRRLGPKIKPHLVILEWYRNDALVPSIDPLTERVVATVIEGQLFENRSDYEYWKSRYIDHTANPIDWSALIRFLRIHWKNFKTLRKLSQRAQTPWALKRGDPGMLRSTKALRSMKAWCVEQGARFAVVMFPAREEVEAEGKRPEYPQALAGFCKEEGIEFLDLSESWRGHWKATGQTLYLPRDRCHPNNAGHAKAAEWIGKAFKPLLKSD